MVDQPLPGDFQAVLQRTALQKHLLEAEVMISLRDLVVSCLGPRGFFRWERRGISKMATRWVNILYNIYRVHDNGTNLIETIYICNYIFIYNIYIHTFYSGLENSGNKTPSQEHRHFSHFEELNCPGEIFETPGPRSFLVAGRHNALCPGLAVAVQNLLVITGVYCLYMVIPMKI